MPTKYKLHPKAEADTFSIYAYSFQHFGEEQAEKYFAGLLDAFTLITEHNHIGKDIGHIRAGYFRLEYESHTIYYRQDQDEILIVRVLSHRQDPLKHL